MYSNKNTHSSYFWWNLTKLNLKSEPGIGEAFTLNQLLEVGCINYQAETAWKGNVTGELFIIRE